MLLDILVTLVTNACFYKIKMISENCAFFPLYAQFIALKNSFVEKESIHGEEDVFHLIEFVRNSSATGHSYFLVWYQDEFVPKFLIVVLHEFNLISRIIVLFGGTSL